MLRKLRMTVVTEYEIDTNELPVERAGLSDEELCAAMNKDFMDDVPVEPGVTVVDCKFEVLS